jgi:hypothetical protein
VRAILLTTVLEEVRLFDFLRITVMLVADLHPSRYLRHPTDSIYRKHSGKLELSILPWYLLPPSRPSFRYALFINFPVLSISLLRSSFSLFFLSRSLWTSYLPTLFSPLPFALSHRSSCSFCRSLVVPLFRFVVSLSTPLSVSIRIHSDTPLRCIRLRSL